MLFYIMSNLIRNRIMIIITILVDKIVRVTRVIGVIGVIWVVREVEMRIGSGA